MLNLTSWRIWKVRSPQRLHCRFLELILMLLFTLIDIPKFNLDRRNSNPPTPSSSAFNDSASNADGQQTVSPEAQSSELPPAAGSEERRASFAAKQRSNSCGSRSSSRSTSFHLPDEDLVRLRRKSAEGGEAVDGDDDELDPEGASVVLVLATAPD
jgi:hypothetical protein